MSKRYANQWALYTGSPTPELAKSANRPASPVYEVPELHDYRRVLPPESHDERLQRVERCMLALTAEWLELTGRKEPPLPGDDREQMRAVADAAKAWAANRAVCRGEVTNCYYNQYASAVIHGERCEEHDADQRLLAALAAWESGERVDVLTAEEWLEIERLRYKLGNAQGVSFSHHATNALASAIDKLLAANGAKP